MENRKMLTLGLLLMVLVVSACQETESGVTATPFESPLDSAQALESPVEVPEASLPQFQGKIAFHSKREGNLQIYLLDGDALTLERLTTDPFGAFEPSWSPDCGSIAFSSGRDSKDSFEIYSMRSDGSDQKRLFKHQPEDDWAPAWSPDGNVIAYQTNPGGRFNICFVSVEGEKLGCLEEGANNASPHWSPDGERIVFTSNRDGDWDIYVADWQEPSEVVKLTDNDFVEKYPQFSPDGSYVAFASERDDNFDIFVMRADGTEETRLTDHSADDVSPRWVGDDKLVFASQRSLVDGFPDWDIYLMDRDGANIVQLTDVAGLDKWPVWCGVSE